MSNRDIRMKLINKSITARRYLMSNAEKFLGAFNNIEGELKYRYNIEQSVGFRKVINDISYKNRIIAMNKKLLESYTDLRNAIVYTAGEDFIIAQPHDDVVEKLKEIEMLILNPPKVIPLFQDGVLTLESTDSILDAIDIMFKNDYSQMPIVEDGEFIGLLNSNTITRWIGAVDKKVDDNGSILILNTRIKDVLLYTEDDRNYEFIDRDYYLHQVIDVFEGNRNMEALLVTHSGSKKEKLMGIITVWDLVRINKKLGY